MSTPDSPYRTALYLLRKCKIEGVEPLSWGIHPITWIELQLEVNPDRASLISTEPRLFGLPVEVSKDFDGVTIRVI